MMKTNKALQAIAIAHIALGSTGQWWDTPRGWSEAVSHSNKRGHYRNNSAQMRAHKNKVTAARHKKNKAAKQARKKARK